MRASFWLRISLVLTCFWTPARLALAEDGEHPREVHREQQLARFYRAFADERAAAVSALLPRHLSWHMIGWREEVVPFAGTYTGREEVRDLFESYFRELNIRQYEFEYALSDGPYTTWHFRLVGDVPATHKTFDLEFVHFWQFDDHGRPTFVRAYYDTQLITDAFTQGGATALRDRKNASDDFRVLCSAYDLTSLMTEVYDRFYTGDVAGVLGMISPDAYVYFQGRDNPQSGEYHGIDGALQFIYNLAGTATPGDISRVYVTEGDRSDVVLFENWTVNATGKPYHVHTVNSWRVDEDGLLMGFINYPDVDAVAAAYQP